MGATKRSAHHHSMAEDLLELEHQRKSMIGSWEQFLGCGTNGGTTTKVTLNEDGTGTCQQNKSAGAAGGEDKEGPVESGKWDVEKDEYGFQLVFTPDGRDPIELSWESG